MIVGFVLAFSVHGRAQNETDTELTSTGVSLGPDDFERPIGIIPTQDPPPEFLSSGVTIGLNFEAARLFTDSNFIPPDTMGAVGPDHIVLIVNGTFKIFDKADGMTVENRSLDSFWTTRVGLAIPNFNDVCVGGFCSVSGGACIANNQCVVNGTGDPRIVFDPASGRWFATSFDLTNPATGDNNLYIGRSDSDDPRMGWAGVMFDADTVGAAEFHDYPTLAVDADGLYICTNDFNAGGDDSCYSIPKADLLLAVPSIANMTRFEATPAGLPSVNGSLQPALDFGPSDGRTVLLGVSGGALVRGDIFGSGAAGATLGTIRSITGDPGHATAAAARQPSPSGQTIENVSPRFVGNVFELDGRLWAVHAVLGSTGNSALRWYEIDEGMNDVLQTGMIEDADIDFHEPSIAVNLFGSVMIGFTGSGPNHAPSSYVSVGLTVGASTVFDAPILLKQGAGHYWRDFRNPPASERNRWGDYSATVIDPVDPCTFWTFQEFVAVSAVGDVGPSPLLEGGLWGIQITELTFRAPVATLPGDVFFPVTCTDSLSTATLEVCNTPPGSGACSNLLVFDITSSDPQFEVIEPTSGYPTEISSDFCFPFQVRFTPTSMGPQSTTLTVLSNDPATPEITVMASGTGGGRDIQTVIADGGDYGDVCLESFRDMDLTINNAGLCLLSITDISSNSGEFQTASVLSYPLVIGPGDMLRFPIRFEPTGGFGPRSAMLTVASNDPVASVAVSGNVPPGDIAVTGSTEFGDVCPWVLAEKTFSVCNVGLCTLNVTGASVDCLDFTIVSNPFPAPVSHDFCLDLVVRFTPTSMGPKSCDLTITSDDPDEPSVVLTLTGNTPVPMIDVPPDQAFPPTVIQATAPCTSQNPFPISNTGTCNLIITNVSITSNAAEYWLSGLPSYPIILPPGGIVGAGDLRINFAPFVMDRDRIGEISVTYISEPITFDTTTVTRVLCGEGVDTGARVLVTHAGVPMANVRSIKLRRVTANFNQPGVNTNDNAMNLALQTVVPALPCQPFQYHREYGTVSNRSMLIPGSYIVTARVRIDNHNLSQAFSFNVDSCGFNPTIVIDFP